MNFLAASSRQAPQPAPTRTRWLVLLLISLMYLITYIDRTGISVAAPEIAKEFGLNQTELGIVFSAFLWAYAIGQLPAGWCADRFGPRIVFLVIVPFWSLMTALTSVASGIASLVGIRFVFGLGEAGGFPTATATGSDIAKMAAAAGIPRTSTVHALAEFTAAFDEALQAGALTTLVAKVEAKGPPLYLTDLPMLENRFQFQRHLRNLRAGQP